jgi:putative phosphoribosyl transferase
MFITPEEMDAQVQKTAAVIRQREQELRGGTPYPHLTGRGAIIVDDGLASGYTMRAAVKFVRARGAGQVVVAVPTGCERTVRELLPLVDELYCLNVRGGWSFAVADAYQNWYDLTEGEVLDILKTLTPAKQP